MGISTRYILEMLVNEEPDSWSETMCRAVGWGKPWSRTRFDLKDEAEQVRDAMIRTGRWKEEAVRVRGPVKVGWCELCCKILIEVEGPWPVGRPPERCPGDACQLTLTLGPLAVALR